VGDDHARARLMLAAKDGCSEQILQKCFLLCGSFTEFDDHGWKVISREGDLEIDLACARMPSHWVRRSSASCRVDGCRIDCDCK
jgi:hypothetical protein